MIDDYSPEGSADTYSGMLAAMLNVTILHYASLLRQTAGDHRLTRVTSLFGAKLNREMILFLNSGSKEKVHFRNVLLFFLLKQSLDVRFAQQLHQRWITSLNTLDIVIYLFMKSAINTESNYCKTNGHICNIRSD